MRYRSRDLPPKPTPYVEPPPVEIKTVEVIKHVVPEVTKDDVQGVSKLLMNLFTKLSEKLQELSSAPKPTAWEHTIVRDNYGLIDKITSTPIYDK
jgi:hypothetical protein